MTLFMTELPVADLDRMIDWYARACGMTIVLRDDPKGFALLEATGGGRLALKRSDEGAVSERSCRLVFRVDDLDGERSRLIEEEVAVSDISENTDEHYREVRFADPEGTPITLFAWAERAYND